MDSDGKNKSRVWNGSDQDFSPDWSPDGTQIAFTLFQDGDGDIYVMNADGSELTPLTNNDAFDGAPSWFPASGTE